MQTTKDKELIAALKKWFKTASFGERDFLNKNQVARLLKEELQSVGYWKNKKRGNRAASERQRLINIAKASGYYQEERNPDEYE